MLCELIKTRKFDEAIRLVKEGANVNEIGKFTWSPLMYATRENQLELVELLLEKGADTNHESQAGYIALSLASRRGNFEVVERLLENRAVVDSRDASMQTPMMLATAKRHYNVVKLLFAHGAEPCEKSNNGFSAWKFVVKENQMDLIRLFLGRGQFKVRLKSLS